MDELYGRLKASRERVQELEKEMQNSTSNVQKREMVISISTILLISLFVFQAAKESDKENDRLKIENIRQRFVHFLPIFILMYYFSQLIEDLKQNINQLNAELEKSRKSTIETPPVTEGVKNAQVEEVRFSNLHTSKNFFLIAHLIPQSYAC